MWRKIFNFINKFNLKLKLYQLVFSDPRTPKIVRVLLGLMLGYVLFPFDFLADLIPGLGFVDDLLVVFSLIWFIFKIIPKKVVEDSKREIRS